MNDELTLIDWTEVETDGVACWEHNERDIAIGIDEYGEVLRITLSRHIEADGYETWLDTTVLTALTIDEAEEIVGELADAVADGIGTVTAIGAEVAEVGDEEFVHFYTVFESSLPDDIEPDDLVFEEDLDDQNAVETTSVMELDEDEIEDEDGIRIEIYPVLIDNVTTYD